MEYFELLSYRKSVRRFTQKEVSQEDLARIIYAANSAPVGSSMYKDVHLTITSDKDILEQLAEAAVKRHEDRETMQRIIGEAGYAERSRSFPVPFYGAPVVIFISHRKQDLQPGIEYSNVACVGLSMHLAATTLNLGSVFIWGYLEAMRVIPELDKTALLKLPEDFEPLLGVAVGHTDTESSAREIMSDKISLNYI